MRKLVTLTVAVLAVVAGGVGTNTAQAKDTLKYPDNNAWIKLWSKRDVSIYPSMRVASSIFRISYSTLETVNGREGGNIHPSRLRTTLCSPWALGPGGGGGVGWNNSGSSAFGPFQFMLDYKGPCFNAGAWGTFGSYDDAAFQEAKRLGYPVPYRFKHPASNVGQAITAAYMISHGGLSHWCASMC